MTVSAADLEQAVTGINFPATKNELVNQAKDNKADNKVVKVLEKLPKRRFTSPMQISKAFEILNVVKMWQDLQC
jgi:Protein of unknown function (DUF2795)